MGSEYYDSSRREALGWRRPEGSLRGGEPPRHEEPAAYVPPEDREEVRPRPMPRSPRVSVPELRGAELQESGSVSITVILFGMIALALVIAGVAANPNLILGAALPTAIALCWWWYRRPRFSGRLGDDALEVDYPPRSIPYERIEEVWDARALRAQDESGRFPIHVLYSGGYLTLPSKLNVDSEEVYSFLTAVRSGALVFRPARPQLEAFTRRQAALFGEENVHVFHARERVGPNPIAEGAKAISLGVAVGALVWTVVGSAVAFKDWFPVGIGLTIGGLLFWVLFWVAGRVAGDPVKRRKEACLVVSPVALALTQGDLKGELRFREILDVSHRGQQAAMSMSRESGMAGVSLKVEGTTIVIADIYDRPTSFIYRLVRNYWDDME